MLSTKERCIMFTYILLISLCIKYVVTQKCGVIFRNVIVQRANGTSYFEPVLSENIPEGLITYVRVEHHEDLKFICKDSLKHISNTLEFELEFSDVVDIEAGAFSGIRNLAFLKLRYNKLTRINQGMFAKLDIISLNLKGNKISVLENGSFADMPKLEILNLGANEIGEITDSWFYNTPSLEYLYLYENAIRALPPKVFASLQKGRNNDKLLSIDFRNNHIADVHSKAFDGLMKYGDINLAFNKIKTLNGTFFNGTEYVLSLNLIFNEIVCLHESSYSILKAKVTYLSGVVWNCSCKEVVKNWASKQHVVVDFGLSDVFCNWDSLFIRKNILETTLN